MHGCGRYSRGTSLPSNRWWALCPPCILEILCLLPLLWNPRALTFPILLPGEPLRALLKRHPLPLGTLWLRPPSTRVDAAKEAIAGQARRLVVPRRSLLLTGGVVAAAGVLAAMPQIAATGVLGEDAAVVVSNEKLLARRERLVRENIDTRYLKIESLGRIYVGKGRSEQDLRLVGSFSLTEAAQADLAAAATALTNLSVYGSLHRLSVTYGGVDSANDPQNVANTATDAPVSPLRVNDSAPLKEEQWLKVLAANAALGTNVSYAQVGLLADELRLNAVVIDENYDSLMKRFRALAELDLKNERVQHIHLNIQLAPEKALSLPRVRSRRFR